MVPASVRASVLTNPFNGMSLEERDRIESEIEATVLECLPPSRRTGAELAAAKLLYFINRGHLQLAEDVPIAPCADIGLRAALPILGQLRGTRGKFHDAIILSIVGSRWPILPPGFFCICGS